ncbi:MAG TPA: endolytic transglycosylase MltG [Thermoanaerobaculia bacterium]|nr:endolytic transglycosylase MltG [Thermoanaerobaculia bacterium]
MSAGRRLARLGLLLLLLALTVTLWFVDRLQRPPSRPGPPSQVDVYFPPGTSTNAIFRRLSAEGVVGNARLAEIYYRVRHGATPLQAGEYRFERPLAIDEVIRRMARGDVVQHTVVVPEGLTAPETFRLFLDQGIGTPEGFRAALSDTSLLPGLAAGAPDLEGFLFPETYRVTRSISARHVVERMLAQFRQHFTPELWDRARTLGLSPRQAVTLASIVEKETALRREAPVVAGVYLNRLNRGMRLQADPTVQYALTRDGRWTGVLHRSDYTYESPYNTYLYEGLPPGPICNPGMAALTAAVTPQRTEFFYFVADASGGHTFSRTFEQHLQAIATNRRLREGTGAAAGPPETPSPSTN